MFKSYIIPCISALSENSLTGLRHLGSKPEEIEKAKTDNKPWCKPYDKIPARKSHLFEKEIKEFTEYTRKYPKHVSNNQNKNYKTDTEYKKYIDFIKETSVRCNRNCYYQVCPFCNHCKVDHEKNSCSDDKWDLVKKEHGTWRRWFVDDSEEISRHEWAILHSYYDPIRSALCFVRCPCKQVLYDAKRSDKDIITMLKHYDSRTLDLNVEKITKLGFIFEVGVKRV
jgi:hypothetical protein